MLKTSNMINIVDEKFLNHSNTFLPSTNYDQQPITNQPITKTLQQKKNQDAKPILGSTEEFMQRSKKAANYLFQIGHSLECSGICGEASCIQTSSILTHIKGCSISEGCLYSGCDTTKKLMTHAETCKSKNNFTYRPGQPFNNNNNNNQKQGFCLICTMVAKKRDLNISKSIKNKEYSKIDPLTSESDMKRGQDCGDSSPIPKRFRCNTISSGDVFCDSQMYSSPIGTSPQILNTFKQDNLEYHEYSPSLSCNYCVSWMCHSTKNMECPKSPSPRGVDFEGLGRLNFQNRTSSI
jgi:hypothetical protein